MLLVPVARTLDAALDLTLGALAHSPSLRAIGNAGLAAVSHRRHRRRNLAAIARMQRLDDHELRDLGVDRISLARAARAPAACDPMRVLWAEAGLDRR